MAASDSPGSARITALLSDRRGYWFLPKHIAGQPTDLVLSGAGNGLPEWLRPPSLAALLEAVAGNPARLGLPEPDHSPLASHPIMNSEVLHHLGHGRIEPRPVIARIDGHAVVFADGRRDEVDEVILAIGYRAALPDLPARLGAGSVKVPVQLVGSLGDLARNATASAPGEQGHSRYPTS